MNYGSPTVGNWTREPKDYSWISLVERTQPRHQLENWRIQMADPLTPQSEKIP